MKLNLGSLPIKTYKDRLIKLILIDMQNSDITSLLLNGFKGFDRFSLDELEHSVIDRYNIEQNQIEKLTTTLVEKMGKKNT